MRDWGFLPSPDDLMIVAAAAKLYRDRWASIRSPFPAAFDGSIDDVGAIDYMNDEGIDVPGGGIETAAIVCGECCAARRGWNGSSATEEIGSSPRAMRRCTTSRSARSPACTKSSAAGVEAP